MSTQPPAPNESLIRAATLLRDARLSLNPFPSFPAELEPAEQRDGYAIQGVLNEMLVGTLGPVAGYKIGCTTPALQAFMNIGNPCAGAVFASTIFDVDAPLELKHFVRMGLECEIGVRLGKDLDARTAPVDRERAAAAVAACFVSVEAVDERYVDYRKLTAPALIADNFMNAGCIFGPDRPGIDPMHLDRARGATVVNGTSVGSGSGSDVLGHPLEALVWLARELGAQGRVLRAGMIVSLGSMVKPYFPSTGDTVIIGNDLLGELTLNIA